MTSFGVDDVIRGKVCDLTRNAKSSGVNINRSLSKLQNILILVRVVAVFFLFVCLFFWENHNSLSIQNGEPKFAKFAYFCEISQFCFDLQTKVFFCCNQHDRLIPNMYTFVCLSVHFRFKKSTSGLN